MGDERFLSNVFKRFFIFITFFTFFNVFYFFLHVFYIYAVGYSVKMLMYMHVARLSDSTTTAAYVNQRLIADRSAGSDRNPSTISDIDVTDTPTHQRNILTTEITTTTMMADQQQTASATVNWSQWQGPVHTHDLPRTLAGLDHITYDYVNHALSVDEHDQYLNTNARQQFEKNISATKGWPICVDLCYVRVSSSIVGVFLFSVLVQLCV